MPAGVAMFCCLLCARRLRWAIAWVNWPFAVLLAVYAVSSTAYSLVFKSRLIVDVILLAGLYTVRIVAGGAAAALEVWASPWLLAYSLFFLHEPGFCEAILGIAVAQTERRAAEWAAGRAYGTGDLDMLANIGLNSGYMSVMVFCLYINSDTVQRAPTASRWCCGSSARSCSTGLRDCGSLPSTEDLHDDTGAFCRDRQGEFDLCVVFRAAGAGRVIGVDREMDSLNFI